jgi:hypothetical protein
MSNLDIEGFQIVAKKGEKPFMKCRAMKCTWTSPLRYEMPLESLIADAIDHRRFCGAAVRPVLEVELKTNFEIRRIRNYQGRRPRG